MRERGAKINPSLGLYPDPQAGRGLIATGELEPDEALLFIPPRLQLRWWRGTEAEAAVGAAWEPPSEQLALQELVAAEVPASMWDFRLTCLLLAAQRPEGALRAAWGAYVDALPSSPPELPLLWTGGRLDEAGKKYPRVAEEASKRVVVLRAIASGLERRKADTERLFGGPVSSQDLAEAYCYACSRAVRVEGGVMAPILDLANHSARPNCALATGKGGVLALVAQRRVESGEPLSISYGPASDAQLLLDYGFTLPEGVNPYGDN